MLTKPVLLTFILTSVAFNAYADGIAIEPGKWEMTSTMNMPMLSQPRVTTVTQCMEEEEITPESMNEDMNDANSDCTFDARVVEGNTMNWSIDCGADTGNSHGEWEATSYGDSLTGAGTITIDVQGQQMVMTMEWAGQRVGACD